VRQNDDGSVFKTDQGNHLLDCDFGPILHPDRLAAKLNQRSGIVEHGLFLGLATDAIVASEKGIRHLKRE
jgi:ribose 5-phosphate isomerase A